MLKKNILTIWLIVLFSANPLHAQNGYTISGTVINEKKEALSGANVLIHELQVSILTDKNGFFEIENVQAGDYYIHIGYLGYRCVHYNVISIEDANVHRIFSMQPDDVDLDEVIIKRNRANIQRKESALSIERRNKEFIEANISGSLMKSLESIAGVSAMEVGQGFAKPVIRGLGFDRVAVTENGIKQEGQQWGADHGLEIDQFAVETIEIIKGPASLMHGSDAVGGVVQIMPAGLLPKNSRESSVLILAKSLNNFAGLSVRHRQRGDRWHYTLHTTLTDFADYKVPADSFFYNHFRLPIYENTLKNTAGKERNISLSSGYIYNTFHTRLTVSNVYSKVGFFPGAHGIPNAANLEHNGYNRSIELPYQMVNHLKLISNSSFFLAEGIWNLDVAYQNNFRQEWSRFHTHYPTQEMPETNPDLELQFKLHTASGNISYKQVSEDSEFVFGLSSQIQKNTIDGYMFLMPEYTRSTSGAFVHGKYRLTPDFVVSGGIRFDYGFININAYFSEYTENYKSPDFSNSFHDFSWAFGASYSISNSLNFKTNAGKSFRMPNVAELGANGIHHGTFRYETGDTAIVSEYSYQLDAGLYFASEYFIFELSPFVNYFPNFIFLSPTGSYLHPNGHEILEADAGQVWQYRQSKAFRAGSELYIEYEFIKNLSLSLTAQYVYATDLTFPIPFTPPLTALTEIDYTFPLLWNTFESTKLKLHSNYSAAQNRTARNELSTPDYQLYGFGVSTTIFFESFNLHLAFQGHNILDAKYFNHLSFYRSIELPEAGRNFQLLLKVNF